MKKNTFITLFTCLCLMGLAQEQQQAFIDVTGTAKMEIIPDEIYVAISIKERNEGRINLSVEKQEQSLKEVLIRLGISIDNLALSDANADYIHVKWRKKRAISRTDYRLKVSTADEAVKVFEALDELKIKSARIVKVSHSKIKDYEKEVRINAIKDAKERADYLLNAIGERTGKVMQVYENKAMYRSVAQRNFNVRNTYDDAVNLFVDELSQQDDKFGTIQFQKIKLQASVFVKFGIE